MRLRALGAGSRASLLAPLIQRRAQAPRASPQGPCPVTPRYLGLSISLGPSGTSVTASLWTGSREGVEYQIHFETKVVRLTKRSPTTLSSASRGITASGEILQTDQGTSAGRPYAFLPPLLSNQFLFVDPIWKSVFSLFTGPLKSLSSLPV